MVAEEIFPAGLFYHLLCSQKSNPVSLVDPHSCLSSRAMQLESVLYAYAS